MRKALTEQYGAPVYVDDDWEIFGNWQTDLEYKRTYFKQ